MTWPDLHALRGVSWDSDGADYFRCAYRLSAPPMLRDYYIGFRPARHALCGGSWCDGNADHFRSVIRNCDRPMECYVSRAFCLAWDAEEEEGDEAS